MNFLQRLSLLFYSTFVMYIAFFWITLSVGYLNYDDYIKLIYLVYTDENLKYIAGMLAGILIVVNYVFYRILSVNVRQDKVYSFENPNGRVSVSLFALEDLIRRMLLQFIEIKDVKPTIRISNKGFQVKIPLVLKSEVNIPEVTTRVQSEVLKKIKDTIGVDEIIKVGVYVGKIHPARFKERLDKSDKSESKDDDSKGPIVPFQGYGS
ncbi:MAG: alkaline shock response membrane anchor protein AmaP [Candidatus Omnitrophota bacterium]